MQENINNYKIELEKEFYNFPVGKTAANPTDQPEVPPGTPDAERRARIDTLPEQPVSKWQTQLQCVYLFVGQGPTQMCASYFYLCNVTAALHLQANMTGTELKGLLASVESTTGMA